MPRDFIHATNLVVKTVMGNFWIKEKFSPDVRKSFSYECFSASSCSPLVVSEEIVSFTLLKKR